MKVVILSHAEVGGAIAATLLARGHEVAFVAGAVHGALLDALDGYDGCLLLGDAPEFSAIAAAFRTWRKAIWPANAEHLPEWTDIPLGPTAAVL